MSVFFCLYSKFKELSVSLVEHEDLKRDTQIVSFRACLTHCKFCEDFNMMIHCLRCRMLQTIFIVRSRDLHMTNVQLSWF